MKRSIIVFLVACLVLLSAGLWIFISFTEMNPMDLLHFAIIIILVAFAFFVGFKRLSNARRGEPAEDELSKKVLQKTAAISYYISLYIWVFMIFIRDRIEFDTEQLLGTGVLAMAITFAISWVVINFRGIKNG
ncbi:MAG TPA: hypothetical protein ENH59_11545 [Bacteroidetes bacterium]|nr:hypothetical protein [Bacteroidota bacterium]